MPLIQMAIWLAEWYQEVPPASHLSNGYKNLFRHLLTRSINFSQVALQFRGTKEHFTFPCSALNKHFYAFEHCFRGTGPVM